MPRLLQRFVPSRKRLQHLAQCWARNHPDTLASRNNLAGVYESAGDLARATPLYEQTLADRVRVLGEDHPDTLTSRNNLAYTYKVAGDLGRAIPLYEQTLTGRVRVLGEDHPKTETVRSDLAVAVAERDGGAGEARQS
ncbi:tetratricopeptide repeat protein [Streptomyces sp. NPDC056501]|uniref:tetratricopeptide repeat protein n=1 Tax=Streptomyces sp. NPDC056501 TaxID=3345841 RepID=UPI0036D11923